jgi:subtilisin family serine protease
VSTASTTNKYGAATAYPFNSNYKIMSISGTSMASPNVAGLSAQLLQLYPGYTPAQIRDLVISNATSNMLYTTGSSTDYANTRSLHGGGNRIAYINLVGDVTYSYIKDATNTWRPTQAVYVKHDDGTWKQAQAGWQKNDAGTWDKIYQR